jgi:anti-anti-sigma factor
VNTHIPPEWPHLVVQVVPRSGGRVCVIGHGEIDMTSVGALADTVTTVLAQESPSHIEVNLAEVTFMDSSGVNALVACRAAAERVGCRITVSHPQPPVRRILGITGLAAVFGLTSSQG